MKKINIILVCILCLMFNMPCLAQEGATADRAKVEKNTAPFSLKYFSIQKHSHYVLVLRVIDRKIVIDEKSKIVEVPGKFPYEVGDFRVNVLDRNGEKISSYKMRDPMLVWTSEQEKNEVTYMKKGKIHIPLPKNKEIASLELVRKDKVFQKLDVSKLMEELIR